MELPKALLEGDIFLPPWKIDLMCDSLPIFHFSLENLDISMAVPVLFWFLKFDVQTQYTG